MEYRYDFAFGDLVFTEDGSFKCPVCNGLTPNQRNLRQGEKIVCSECKSEFKKN
jgi:formylmethanofuran dehydrogenase subunit E